MSQIIEEIKDFIREYQGYIDDRDSAALLKAIPQEFPSESDMALVVKLFLQVGYDLGGNLQVLGDTFKLNSKLNAFVIPSISKISPLYLSIFSLTHLMRFCVINLRLKSFLVKVLYLETKLLLLKTISKVELNKFTFLFVKLPLKLNIKLSCSFV